VPLGQLTEGVEIIEVEIHGAVAAFAAERVERPEVDHRVTGGVNRGENGGSDRDVDAVQACHPVKE